MTRDNIDIYSYFKRKRTRIEMKAINLSPKSLENNKYTGAKVLIKRIINQRWKRKVF